VPVTPVAAATRPIVSESVDPGRSLAWWAEAWTLLLRSPLRWLLLGAALMLGFGLLGMVPLAGALVAALLSPVLVGGWMLTAHQVQGGAAPGAMRLLAGFRGRHLKPLLTLGTALAGATLLMIVVDRVLGVSAMAGGVAIDAPADAAVQAALHHSMLALLLLLAFSIVVSAALWFAPALVVLRGATPWQAARASLRAVLDNGLTFLLYGMVQLLLMATVTSLPYQLGWLLLVPLMLLTAYVSYREVFEA
jgi:hypothetical protein